LKASTGERSVLQIFTNAKVKSGINLCATVHTWRHSFATHLLESGVDLCCIQDVLGREGSKATEIYTYSHYSCGQGQGAGGFGFVERGDFFCRGIDWQ
jgi:site-specific recombinase XerD